MLFMVLITTVVVAIITGIIVDTFSELRAQQEDSVVHAQLRTEIALRCCLQLFGQLLCKPGCLGPVRGP